MFWLPRLILFKIKCQRSVEISNTVCIYVCVRWCLCFHILWTFLLSKWCLWSLIKNCLNVKVCGTHLNWSATMRKMWKLAVELRREPNKWTEVVCALFQVESGVVHFFLQNKTATQFSTQSHSCVGSGFIVGLPIRSLVWRNTLSKNHFYVPLLFNMMQHYVRCRLNRT